MSESKELSVKRRALIASGIVLTTATAFSPALIKPARAATKEIRMLNKHPRDPARFMVFAPEVVRVSVGDTVKFTATDAGHNTESLAGMIPPGVKPWISEFNKDYDLTLQKPGVYCFKCSPHVVLGMVGAIIVEGDGWDANLAAAKAVKQTGLGKIAFDRIWLQIDALMA